MSRRTVIILGSSLVLVLIGIIYLLIVRGEAHGLLCVLPAAALLVIPIMFIFTLDPRIIATAVQILRALVLLGIIVLAGYGLVLLFLKGDPGRLLGPMLVVGLIASMVLSALYRPAAIASLALGFGLLLVRLKSALPLRGFDAWIDFLDPNHALEVLLIIIGAFMIREHGNVRAAKKKWRSYAKDSHWHYEETRDTFGMNGDCAGRTLLVESCEIDPGGGVSTTCTKVEVKLENPIEASFLMKWRPSIYRFFWRLFPPRPLATQMKEHVERYYYIDSHPEGFLGKILEPALWIRLMRAGIYQITLEGNTLMVIKWGLEKKAKRISEYGELTVEMANGIEKASSARGMQYFPDEIEPAAS